MHKTEEFISSILRRKRHCVFISPHLDDVALSCAALIQQLSGKTPITIVNVFTAADTQPYTFSARKFLSQSGKFFDALQVFEERVREDQKVLNQFKVTVVNLGLVDALFRKRSARSSLGRFIPEINHLYPTYRWHILNSINPHDSALQQLESALQRWNNSRTVVFAPYGIGNHVDHQLARQVCQQVFSEVVLYSDFPYNIRTQSYGTPIKRNQEVRIQPKFEWKKKLLQGYQTQFAGLFENGELPVHEEVYFET